MPHIATDTHFTFVLYGIIWVTFIHSPHPPFFNYYYYCASRWPEDAQEEMSVLQISDQGTGEGVLFQRLHQQGKASAALADAQPDRSTGQNLVSEQEDEGEETEQGPFTVLHHKPPAIKTLNKDLSLAHSHAPSHLYTSAALPGQDGDVFFVSGFIKNSTIYTLFCH